MSILLSLHAIRIYFLFIFSISPGTAFDAKAVSETATRIGSIGDKGASIKLWPNGEIVGR